MNSEYINKRDILNSLEHLHGVLLMMMTEIDDVCKKHQIKYYLNGGNALGAVRHNGFIPWDDDMDIMMRTEDYRKFIRICKEKLDPDKWYVQEAWVDWPGCFSKIRLRNTYFEDIGEWKGIPKEKRGIYIDVFELVNAPNSKFLKVWQYGCAKLLNAYSLTFKQYQTDSIMKKVALNVSKMMSVGCIFKLIKNGVYRYSNKDTGEVANFYGMSRFRNAFYTSDVFMEPIYHDFDSISLPLPTKYEFYLTNAFGDYMQLPPIEKRRPLHSSIIDFGQY